MLEKIEPMEFIEDDEIIRLFHERKREQEAFRLLVNIKSVCIGIYGRL